MKFAVHRIDREFAPAEVAEITDVSVSLQRDWRRRNILPERKSDGWSRFNLADVIEIYVLKFFSDAGFSVKDVLGHSSMAVLPILVHLSGMPGAVVFEGDPIGDEQRERILLSMATDADVAANANYLVIAHGADVPLEDRVGRFKTLSAVESWLEGKSFEGFTAIDFSAMAAMISASVEGPLIRMECEMISE